MPRHNSPDLTLPLTQPITLTRGPRSHLVTLMDAAILIRDLEPFRQARPVWDRAAEMIMLAGTTKEAADVQEATRQILVALGHENAPSFREVIEGTAVGSRGRSHNQPRHR